VKYAFIEKHENEYRVSSMCRLMQVSRSGYYAWRDRPAQSDAQQNELLSQIRRVHVKSRQAYGAKKTWLALKSQGISCGKHSVARLRKQAGIEARRKRRFRITVENHATAPAAPNLVQQQFQVDHPNRIWVGDMTFIRTRQGWLYLAILLDLYSRKVVGWSMSDRPDLALILSEYSGTDHVFTPPTGTAGCAAACSWRQATVHNHPVAPSTFQGWCRMRLAGARPCLPICRMSRSIRAKVWLAQHRGVALHRLRSCRPAIRAVFLRGGVGCA